MKKWYNIELDKADSEDLRMILAQYKIKYETSQVDNLTHFEIYCDSTDAYAINECLDMCRMVRGC